MLGLPLNVKGNETHPGTSSPRRQSEGETQGGKPKTPGACTDGDFMRSALSTFLEADKVLFKFSQVSENRSGSYLQDAKF